MVDLTDSEPEESVRSPISSRVIARSGLSNPFGCSFIVEPYRFHDNGSFITVEETTVMSGDQHSLAQRVKLFTITDNKTDRTDNLFVRQPIRHDRNSCRRISVTDVIEPATERPLLTIR
jgi:hypothetical protein